MNYGLSQCEMSEMSYLLSENSELLGYFVIFCLFTSETVSRDGNDAQPTHLIKYCINFLETSFLFHVHLRLSDVYEFHSKCLIFIVDISLGGVYFNYILVPSLNGQDKEAQV